MSHGIGSRRGLATKNETRNINDMRARGGTKKRNDGDFEQMFGRDIDKYLEESEWDIESYEKMSHFSRGSGKGSIRGGAKLKTMEKAYLQRIEADGGAKKGYGKKAQGSLMTGPGKKTQATKKPPAFREFQDRFVDNPDFIHKGEILEFDTAMDKQNSSQKKNKTA